MILFHTENSVFEVQPASKLIRRTNHAGNPHWTEGRWVPYEFIEHTRDGGLYVHAFDPDTNKLRPFLTSAVTKEEVLT